jgi:hypothetical protein
MLFSHPKALACLAALPSMAIANNNGRDNHHVATRATSRPILETKGGVTRHLGITRPTDFGTVWVWALDSHGLLSRKNIGSDEGWHTYNSSSFISAPSFLNVWHSSDDLRVAFAIQAGTGHLMYLPYFDEKWENDQWHDLGGRFAYRPAAVAGTTGLSGVFGVSDKGELLYSSLENQYFLPLKFNEWQILGKGFTGEVSVASATPGMYELVGLVNGTIRQGLTDYSGSAPEWADLGRPPHSRNLGWPKIVAIGDTRTHGSPRGYLDVVVVADGVVWHKQFDGKSWPKKWTRLPASHSGLEIVNSQEVLLAYQSETPSTGYLFSRGSDDCVYQNQFSYSGYNETTGDVYMDWIGWNSLVSICPCVIAYYYLQLC